MSDAWMDYMMSGFASAYARQCDVYFTEVLERDRRARRYIVANRNVWWNRPAHFSVAAYDDAHAVELLLARRPDAEEK